MTMEESVREAFAQDQRLVILRTLLEVGGNDSVITDAVQVWGHKSCDRDHVRQHLRWLEVSGLVTIETMRNGVLVPSITSKGEKVARGELRIEGIKRPSAR